MIRRTAAGFALALALVAGAGASGCGYRGSAVDVSPRAIAAEPGWITVRDVPLVEQQGKSDCGAAALTMLLRFWGADASTTLADVAGALPSDPEKPGQRAGDLRDLARARGLEAFLVTGEIADLETQLAQGRPLLVGLLKPVGIPLGKRQRALSHYEIVIGYHPEKKLVLTLDPAEGLRKNTVEGFAREWEPSKRLALIAFKK